MNSIYLAQQHEGLSAQYARSADQFGGDLGDAYSAVAEAHKDLADALRSMAEVSDEQRQRPIPQPMYDEGPTDEDLDALAVVALPPGRPLSRRPVVATEDTVGTSFSGAINAFLRQPRPKQKHNNS